MDTTQTRTILELDARWGWELTGNVTFFLFLFSFFKELHILYQLRRFFSHVCCCVMIPHCSSAKAEFLVNDWHEALATKINYLTSFAFLCIVLSVLYLPSPLLPSTFCCLPQFSAMGSGFSHSTDVCAFYHSLDHYRILVVQFPSTKIDSIRNNALRSWLLNILVSAYVKTENTLNTKPSVL